jgi:ketosteroid isomerase-like protein
MRVVAEIVLALVCAAALAEQKTPEAEIADLEQQLGQAMIHKDVDTLAALVGDEWTIQQDSDQLGSKAGFIRDIRSGTLVVTSFKLHDVRVRVFRDVAMVQAFDDEASSYDGKDGSGTYSWMDVWRKRDGHWVSIATQLTKVRPKAPEQAAIDTGNQAWIEGVKSGDVDRILATYSSDAVDCGPGGECFTGKDAIDRHMREQLGRVGRAQSAAVKSLGSSAVGDFVYEWGQAEAAFGGGNKLVEKYLTAWRRQGDGSWKIFRNLVIPQ